MHQQTRLMKVAVSRARAGDYAGSIMALDRVTSGDDTEALAKSLVEEWICLRGDSRASTNILVLENQTVVPEGIEHATLRLASLRLDEVAARSARGVEPDRVRRLHLIKAVSGPG